MLLVVGKAPLTPDGYDVGNEGLVYLDAPEAGDGRVTLESAMLPGVSTWQLDAEHAHLADEEGRVRGLLELLETGTTELLPRFARPRPAAAWPVCASPPVRSRPARDASCPVPLERESDLYAVEAIPGMPDRSECPGTQRCASRSSTAI